MNKFYHNNYDHNTNKCNQLRDKIEFQKHATLQWYVRLEAPIGGNAPLQLAPIVGRLEIVIAGPHLAGNSRKALESGADIASCGNIKLQLTVGTDLKQNNIMATFILVDVKSLYNLVGCLLCNQETTCKCYNTSSSLAKKTSFIATAIEGTNKTSLVATTPRGRAKPLPQRDEIDPDLAEINLAVGLTEELREFPLNTFDSTKVVKLGTNLTKVLRISNEAQPSKMCLRRPIRSLSQIKDMQSLTGRIAALSRFVSKSTDNSVPFFNPLKGRNKGFESIDEYDQAFQALKHHPAKPHILSKSMDSEELYIYLAITEHAASVGA
uniref:Uncharacterized protein n=1 Tax=Cannabis sativa TaxID=3483 RepID=A0A803PZE6_CANSA